MMYCDCCGGEIADVVYIGDEGEHLCEGCAADEKLHQLIPDETQRVAEIIKMRNKGYDEQVLIDIYEWFDLDVGDTYDWHWVDEYEDKEDW